MYSQGTNNILQQFGCGELVTKPSRREANWPRVELATNNTNADLRSQLPYKLGSKRNNIKQICDKHSKLKIKSAIRLE